MHVIAGRGMSSTVLEKLGDPRARHHAVPWSIPEQSINYFNRFPI